jgi:hypothetical protein
MEKTVEKASRFGSKLSLGFVILLDPLPVVKASGKNLITTEYRPDEKFLSGWLF